MATYINLTDTGKYDTGSNYQDATAIANEEKAYGSAGTKGTALNLRVTKISLNSGMLVDDSPALQKKKSDTTTLRYTGSEVDKVGVGNDVWTFEIVFDTNNTTTDMRNFGRLMHMRKTKGYKELRFGSSQGDSTFPARIITYSKYGEREYDSEATKTIGDAGTPINVRIKSCAADHSMTQGTKITVKLVLVETQ